MKWDESKSQDKDFLKTYYEFRANYWQEKGFEKISKHFRKALKKL